MSTPLHTADILIIGTGAAGVTVAREVRKIDKSATIHMVTSDNGVLYSKPMLSNALAQGKTPETLVQKHAEDWSNELDVTVWANTEAVAIQRDYNMLSIRTPQGSDTVQYRKLVIANGAHPRPYTVLGARDDTFSTVNSLDDYAQWRARLDDKAEVLIVGAGLIGVEFANDLAIHGHTVHVVDPAPSVLGRLLPEQVGGVLQSALEDQGIHFYMGTAIKEVQGGTAVLQNGQAITFERALSAIGLIPNTKLAKEAGLDVDQGIVVNALMQTSDEDIFAIGDCAQTQAGVLPYILPIMTAARALAKTLVVEDTPVVFPAMPVAVKTPALPTVICPPKPGTDGHWAIEGEGRDWRATFIAPDGQAVGFALTGEHTKARQSMAKNMPSLMAA